MRILQLGKFYPVKGGVEKVMYDLVTGLSSRGIRCDMLCASATPGPGFTVPVNEYSDVHVCRTLRKVASTMLSPAMILKLRRMARDYDIIHVHHPDPMAALALMLSGYRGKVVLHWHSDILKQKALLRAYSPIQSWLIRRADMIVGTTPVYVKESPFLAEVQDKVTYLPIGVDRVVADPSKVEEVRRAFAGKRLILNVGRCIYYKGHEYLIEAAAMLPDDCHLIIAGEGPLRGKDQELIESLGLHDKVSMLGFVSDEDLAALYEACDVFVLSSVEKTEAFAIVQIEAMSCGKPVVATRIPGSGVAWVNADGESGLNVPVRDSKALADAISAVLAPERYGEFSSGARSRYQSMFTKESMLDRCVGLYSECI